MLWNTQSKQMTDHTNFWRKFGKGFVSHCKQRGISVSQSVSLSVCLSVFQIPLQLLIRSTSNSAGVLLTVRNPRTQKTPTSAANNCFGRLYRSHRSTTYRHILNRHSTSSFNLLRCLALGIIHLCLAVVGRWSEGPRNLNLGRATFLSSQYSSTEQLTGVYIQLQTILKRLL